MIKDLALLNLKDNVENFKNEVVLYDNENLESIQLILNKLIELKDFVKEEIIRRQVDFNLESGTNINQLFLNFNVSEQKKVINKYDLNKFVDLLKEDNFGTEPDFNKLFKILDSTTEKENSYFLKKCIISQDEKITFVLRENKKNK